MEEKKNWIEKNLKAVLAVIIVLTWVASKIWTFKDSQDIINSFMILVGYFWGSSSSSQKKDETIKNLKYEKNNISDILTDQQ